MKSIYLLMTGGVHWMGGVQYTRNILHALSLLPASKRPQVVLSLGVKNTGAGYEQEFSHYDFVRIEHAPEWVGKFHKLLSRKGGRKLSARLAPVTRRFCHIAERCTVAYPVKGHPLALDLESVLWIPDFQYKVMPHYFAEDNRAKRDKLYHEMLSSKSMLVLSSHAVAKDFAQYFPNHADTPVRVLQFRSYMNDEDYAVNAQMTCAQYDLPERFLYLPNQFFVHKRHDVAFAALAKLKREGIIIPLVCTGSSDDFRSSEYYKTLTDMIERENIAGQVTILGLIPREQQIQIYRRAALVLQPSSFEGWSTSVEDAVALGKTILLSDIDTHKEQAPEHGHFFANANTDSLADQLRQLWPLCQAGPDKEREAKARKRNHEQCIIFAETFLSIMQEAHQRHLDKKQVLNAA